MFEQLQDTLLSQMIDRKQCWVTEQALPMGPAIFSGPTTMDHYNIDLILTENYNQAFSKK